MRALPVEVDVPSKFERRRKKLRRMRNRRLKADRLARILSAPSTPRRRRLLGVTVGRNLRLEVAFDHETPVPLDLSLGPEDAPGRARDLQEAVRAAERSEPAGDA